MRLSEQEIAAIRDCARVHFGAGAVVRLFGSRVDDAKRGGDIDLHITAERDELATFRTELDFLGDLQKRIGECRVDVVLRGPAAESRVIDRIAKRTGVRL